MEPTFKLKAALWLWQGKGAWHFITIPKDLTDKIKSFDSGPRRGFGSVKVEVTIGETSWKTSIFPTKEGTFCLPIKAAVRKKENLSLGDEAQLTIQIQI
jgi:hypothetical protein